MKSRYLDRIDASAIKAFQDAAAALPSDHRRSRCSGSGER